MCTKIADDFKCGENFQHGENVVIFPDVVVGDNVIIGNNITLRPGTRIGDNLDMADDCLTSGAVLIGNNVNVRQKTALAQGTIIEDDAFLGGAVMTNHAIHVTHRRPKVKTVSFTTRIGAGCVIGSQTFIAPAAHIAPLAIIGSCSAVFKPVTEAAVYVGNPLRRIRDLPEEYIIPVSEERMTFPPEIIERYLSYFKDV